MAWTITFDFLLNTGGFINDAAHSRPFGNRINAVGWHSVWGTVGGFDERLNIIRTADVVSGTITDIDVYYTTIGIIGAAPVVATLINDIVVVTSGFTAPNVFVQSASGLSEVVGAATSIRTSVVGGGGGLLEGQLDIINTKIVLQGTGPEPFIVPTSGKLRTPFNFIESQGGGAEGGAGGGAGDIASISADGLYIYMAAFNSLDFPTLIKILAVLSTDGSVVFEPEDGGRIGVKCGKSDANVVWVAGSFDSTNTVEKSEDAGSSFDVKDDGTIGTIRTFEVGSDADTRVIVFDGDNSDILETIDDGVSWTTINAAVGFLVNSIARFGLNVLRCVFGNPSAVNDNIDYSINVGANLEDYSTGFPQAEITKVIVK